MPSVLRLLPLLAAFALRAHASVTITFGGDDFRTSSNGSLLDGSLVLLLAKTTGAATGFSTLQAGALNVGDFLNGNYQVLGRTGVDSSSTAHLTPGASGATNPIALASGSFADLTTGDQLAVVWFPDLTALSSFSFSSGASYGLYTVDNSSTWQVPADGSTFDVKVPDGVIASFTAISAIPEPSTYAALTGLAVLGIAGWRRRKRA
jgi:hypothetical protein